MSDLEKLADEIARKIDRAVGDVEKKVRTKWKGNWKSEFDKTAYEFRSKTSNIRKMPDRLSDLATDGGCAMRYLLAYGVKSVAFFLGLGGLIAAATALPDAHPDWEQITAGLSLLIAAQFLWWGGNRVKRSAEKRAYVRDQNRIIRLAREKGGNLTVLEAATESRLAVEKADEILRELAVMGHAEMRVSDSGMVVYHFPEIERWDEKHWAKPVDEL